MLGYPPKLTTTLPDKETFKADEWIAQPRFDGWRVVVHKDNVYTPTGELLLSNMGFPKTNFEYQLDMLMMHPQKPKADKVQEALDKGIQSLKPLDVYLPFAADMKLPDRIIFLKKELNIAVPMLSLRSYDDIFRLNTMVKMYSYSGLIIKKKDGVYRISKHCCALDRNWVRVE